MLGTVPANSHFLPNQLVLEGRIHKLNVDIVSLTFHQPMVGFLGNLDHFSIMEHVMFLVRSANFQR